jgi:hypothetical protein
MLERPSGVPVWGELQAEMADEVPMTEPRLAKHNENRFNWGTLHGASVPGYVRAVRAPFAATNHASYVLLVPRGQGAPAHRSTGEHTVILLEGEVEFEFPDDRPAELFVMNEHDLLFPKA